MIVILLLHAVAVCSFSLMFIFHFVNISPFIHSAINGFLSSFGLDNTAGKVPEHVSWCTRAWLSDGYVYFRVKALCRGVCLYSVLIEYVYISLTHFNIFIWHLLLTFLVI